MQLGDWNAKRVLICACVMLLFALYLTQSWLTTRIYAGPVFDLSPTQTTPNSCRRPVNQWERHLLDGARPGQAAFIYFADIDHDGIEDVVTGGFWYRNVQSVAGPWTRHAVGAAFAETLAVHDFDGDGDLDLLGASGTLTPLPFVWASNDGRGQFTVFANIDSNLAPPDRAPIQGVTVARFQPNGPLEVALAWDKEYAGTQMLTVPADPTSGQWTRRQASPFTQGEALSNADLDGDGDLDLFTGTAWLRNEWQADQWTPIVIHTPISGAPDRHRLVDMDQDGDLDAVVGYGHDPEAKVAWYEQPATPTTPWPQHLVANLTTPARGYPQNLDVADLDGDGDLDIVTAQHHQKHTELRALVLENIDGAGKSWAQHEIYSGDEHHDGMQLLDVEGDGDLDVISIGWTHGQVILYENKGTTTCPPTTPVVTPPATLPVIPTATPTAAPTATMTPINEPQRQVNGQLFLPLVTR